MYSFFGSVNGFAQPADIQYRAFFRCYSLPLFVTTRDKLMENESGGKIYLPQRALEALRKKHIHTHTHIHTYSKITHAFLFFFLNTHSAKKGFVPNVIQHARESAPG